jgi:hypothetical protein
MPSHPPIGILRPRIVALNLTMGIDYAVAYDSSIMARFWFLKPGAGLARVQSACQNRQALATALATALANATSPRR